MKCLDKFDPNDTLYHYTKTTTALEYILFNKKLRLSDRVNSNDPIENMTPRTLVKVENLENETNENWARYSKDIKKKMAEAKQVCFCMNDTSNRYENMTDKPHEFYGGLKPRMWEQYADNYNGVCLILSKAELLNQLDDNYTRKEVNYVSYDDLKNKKIEIDSRELRGSNYEICLKQVFDEIDKYIFHKHQDYVGENEYRICAYSDEVQYINIESAIKGLIISENNSKYFEDKLLEFAENYKIDIFKINWKSYGSDVFNLIDWIKASKRNRAIGEKFKKQKLNKQE